MLTKLNITPYSKLGAKNFKERCRDRIWRQVSKQTNHRLNYMPDTRELNVLFVISRVIIRRLKACIKRVEILIDEGL